MAQLTVDIGGRPGLDCRGFCEYCYFKRVKESDPFGCQYCLPFQKGCDYCSRGVREYYHGFKPLRNVADEVLLSLGRIPDEVTKITISGGGDPSCYPWLKDLIELLASIEAPVHIGYTSGKGFDDPDIADFLIANNLSEISFTVFSVDPALRSRYMHDPTPEASLAVLEKLCSKIDVYAAMVVIPGINDGEVLEETCRWLSEKGAKGLILMRFANSKEQGLILGNAPVIKGITPHSPVFFKEMVTDLNLRYNIKINGTPLWDSDKKSPFAILSEPDLLGKLPRVTRNATIISGSIAGPYIQEILQKCGFSGNVTILKKEIACLITIDDIKDIDLSMISPVIIIPGRAFVHDFELQKVLSSDGVERAVFRGPDMLTADGETSMGMTREDVLSIEQNGISDLIRLVNMYGIEV